MAAHSYADLIQHDGHNVVIVTYGDGANVAIECDDCYTVLRDFDRPEDDGTEFRWVVNNRELEKLTEGDNNA